MEISLNDKWRAYVRTKKTPMNELINTLFSVFRRLTGTAYDATRTLNQVIELYKSYAGKNSVPLREIVRLYETKFLPLSELVFRVMKRRLQTKKEIEVLKERILQWKEPPSVLVAAVRRHESQRDMFDVTERSLNVKFTELECMVTAVASTSICALRTAKTVCMGKECSNCMTPLTEGSMRCSRCKAAHYCGEACQKQHWKDGHKRFCEPVAARIVKPEPHKCHGCKKEYCNGSKFMATFEKTCPVCLDPLLAKDFMTKTRVLPCGHEMHQKCTFLVSVYCVSKTCPMCRAPF